jgi:hypothetical protein
MIEDDLSHSIPRSGNMFGGDSADGRGIKSCWRPAAILPETATYTKTMHPLSSLKKRAKGYGKPTL